MPVQGNPSSVGRQDDPSVYPLTPVASYYWDITSLSWLKANEGGLAVPTYDATALAQNATQDIWTFFTGGLGGTLVATITITYTDATKATISTVVRT